MSDVMSDESGLIISWPDKKSSSDKITKQKYSKNRSVTRQVKETHAKKGTSPPKNKKIK